jgi:putative ABC transport system ATP-binding protein
MNIPNAALIQLQDVSKSYQRGHARFPVLREVTFKIGKGEFVGLTGPSGSGKSTLLHVCGLLDRPDTGYCRIEGREMGNLSSRALGLFRREKIGFIFQGFNLMPALSAFENVEIPLLLGGIPLKNRSTRVLDILDRVGLKNLTRQRPDDLSGGQRQRVAIARALVKIPKLVIADEPTANLDGTTAAQIIDVMRELGRSHGVTFIVATHDLRMASHCDRVLMLNDGIIS